MRRPANQLFSIVAILGLCLCGTAALAQYDGPPPPQAPQVYDGPDAPEIPGPNRGVARLSIIAGEVSVKRGDANEVVAAAINAPVVASDIVLTGDGSRAEIQFDYSNMLRLAPLSEVRIAELDYRRYQIQVGRGTVLFRVLRDRDAEVELSTPSVSVRPVKSGTYRVTVFPDGTSEITVRAGEAEIFTPRGSERVRSGRTVIARGNPADPEFQYVGARGADDFDYWCDRRDQDLQRSRAYQYVPTDVYGADDLDHYGQWENTPDYGAVWVPTNTSPDWAPYRYGRWTWVDYYGWSWVSYDPWGWAPYHYGRWFYRANRWCWYPGGLHTRQYWSPALVAFFGFGNGGVGVGFGRIGWVPLAPHEAFHPWWGSRSYGGYRNAYFDRNINVANTYRNVRYNGVSGVDSGAFGRGRVNSFRISEADLRGAGQFRGGLPVTPTRESLRWSDHQASIPRGGLSTENHRFYSSRPATQANRVPFEQQRQAIEQANTRQFGGARGEGSRTFGQQGTPADSGFRRGENPAPASGSNEGGFRRFGDPGQSRGAVEAVNPQNAYRPNDTPGAARGEGSNNAGAGWRRFAGSEGSNTPNPAIVAPRTDLVPRTDSGRGSYNRGRMDQPPQQQAAPAPAPRNEPNGYSYPRQAAPSYSRGDSSNRGASRGEAQQPAQVNRGSFGRSESPRMQSAPIVRERQAAPAPSSRSESRGNGGGGRGEGSNNSNNSRSSGDRGGRNR